MTCGGFDVAAYLQNWIWEGIHDQWTTLVVLVLIGIVVAFLVIPALIRFQRGASVGQQVYESGPATHLAKQGTPTLGGIAFVIAALAAVAYIEATGGASRVLEDSHYWIVDSDVVRPILFAGFIALVAGIGFIDDFLILSRRTALGLRARTKMLLLLIVAAAAVYAIFQIDPSAYYCTDPSQGVAQWWFGTTIYVPFAWFCALAVIAIVGCANAVNLTDGVDGLAGAVSLPPLIVLSLAWGGWIGLSVAGALAVFLYFNRHPAKVFMGDTGSLTLGALIAFLAIEAHLLLFLPLLGIVFVVEALSVIAQVVSFKLTGTRIFKMSPLHHHFELSGWSEQKITATFTAISLLASVAFCEMVYASLRVLPH